MDDADAERVAQRCKELRQESGLSVPETAGAIKCVRDTVYKVERGVILPSLGIIWSLAELFQAYPLDLLTFPDVDDRYELIEMTRNATAEQLREMKAACRAITGKRRARARKG